MLLLHNPMFDVVMVLGPSHVVNSSSNKMSACLSRRAARVFRTSRIGPLTKYMYMYNNVNNVNNVFVSGQETITIETAFGRGYVERSAKTTRPKVLIPPFR